jgi:hypothetical protein
MRVLTLSQVREVLSGPQAASFLEAWRQVEQETSEASELVTELVSQSAVAEARVKVAEESARESTELAEEERRRALAMGPGADCGPLLRRELDALASGHLLRASRALDEAAERRKRSAALREQASEARARMESARIQQAALRRDAARLSDCVGQSCLFFAGAEEPGAAYIFPLSTITHVSGDLQAFVLYRLAPGAPLEAAVAIRDVVPPDAESSVGSDISVTPRERAPRRAKETP